MSRYFRDLTKLEHRNDDIPGVNMVLDPKNLIEIPNDESQIMRTKIYDDSHHLNPALAAYENIFAVISHHFLCMTNF